MPRERPLQSREGSDKPRVQSKEKGEWKSSLRIKQLEGAMIYLSIGGNGEKESKLRREDGKNFTGGNCPPRGFHFVLSPAGSLAASPSLVQETRGPTGLGSGLVEGLGRKRAVKGILQKPGFLRPSGASGGKGPADSLEAEKAGGPGWDGWQRGVAGRRARWPPGAPRPSRFLPRPGRRAATPPPPRAPAYSRLRPAPSPARLLYLHKEVAPGPARGAPRAAVTSDPARRQPIRAQVVSKPKISTSAKVKMEGSRAEREGGSPPGNAWLLLLEGQAGEPVAGAGGAMREGAPALGGRSPTTRPQSPAPRGHPALRQPPVHPTAPPALVLGGCRVGDGGERLGGRWGRHFADLLHGCNSCSGAVCRGRGLSGLGGRSAAETARAGGAGPGLRTERVACARGKHRGSAGSSLTTGAERIPESGWVERRGEDCIDASSGAGRGQRGDRELSGGNGWGKGGRCGGPELPRFPGPSHPRGISRACIRPSSPPLLTLPAPRIRLRAAPSPTNFPEGKVKSCHELSGVS
ncbi:translation initiation factor IF-2-like [Cervus canadensis]|uniref:translation initiation factor IF-2-like n=1 Tax=Cervus canadensis TaxID=1574408 RepID=UPI001C9E8865|nr:translation initiation factor IF-2-like [Cervus canadensis]